MVRAKPWRPAGRRPETGSRPGIRQLPWVLKSGGRRVVTHGRRLARPGAADNGAVLGIRRTRRGIGGRCGQGDAKRCARAAESGGNARPRAAGLSGHRRIEGGHAPEGGSECRAGNRTAPGPGPATYPYFRPRIPRFVRSSGPGERRVATACTVTTPGVSLYCPGQGVVACWMSAGAFSRPTAGAGFRAWKPFSFMIFWPAGLTRKSTNLSAMVWLGLSLSTVTA